jgi:hypothetical protein
VTSINKDPDIPEASLLPAVHPSLLFSQSIYMLDGTSLLHTEITTHSSISSQ